VRPELSEVNQQKAVLFQFSKQRGANATFFARDIGQKSIDYAENSKSDFIRLVA
jgi:hypothetical protein